MPVAIGTVCYRRSDMTPEAFKDYFDNKHVPLLLSLVGEEGRPISYRRNYMVRDASGKPALLAGKAEEATWDCFSEVVFRDEEHAMAFKKAYMANAKAINEDEAKFFDHSKIIVASYVTEGY